MQVEIFNLYSQQEVDSMLSQSIREVFAEQALKLEKQDLKLAEQRREFDASRQDTAKYHEAQLREQRSELQELRKELRSEVLTSRRWVIGTVISLAAYLSALIHFNH